MQRTQADGAVVHFKNRHTVPRHGKKAGRGILHHGFPKLFGNMQQGTGLRVFPFGLARLSGEGPEALVAPAGHKTRHKSKERQRPCHRNSISCQWVTHKKGILDCLNPAGKNDSFRLTRRAMWL